MKPIDLTHTITPDIPGWDGSCGFKISLSLDYKDCTAPDLFRKHDIITPTGVGTHMDAPAHCLPGGKTIDELSLDVLVTDCIAITVADLADENFVIMPSDIEAFEKTHGTIPRNSFVVFHTGWAKYWDTPNKYHNGHKFPSVHSTTAELLLSRGIAGLGTDTLSTDTGEHGFPVHQAILGAGKYLVENIANAAALPPTGAKILVLPMKIGGGTESPLRLIALL